MCSTVNTLFGKVNTVVVLGMLYYKDICKLSPNALRVERLKHKKACGVAALLPSVREAVPPLSTSIPGT